MMMKKQPGSQLLKKKKTIMNPQKMNWNKNQQAKLRKRPQKQSKNRIKSPKTKVKMTLLTPTT